MGDLTPIKRPRGRPRIDGLPAGSSEAKAAGAPAHISFTAGSYLMALFTVIFTRPIGEENKEARKKAFDSEIVFVRNWREIEIRNGGRHGNECIARFKHGSAFFWEGHVKRTTVLNGRAALLLGFGKGRDYVRDVVEA